MPKYQNAMFLFLISFKGPAKEPPYQMLLSPRLVANFENVRSQTPEKVGRENERRSTTNPQSRKGIFSLFLKANLY